MDDEAAIAVEDGAQEVESTSDIEVADIHMPLLVRLQRLHEAGAFLGDVGRLAGQEAGPLEDAINAGGAAGDDILIEHHEGQAAIALVGMAAGELADTCDFARGEPVIARHPGIVLVDLAEALYPVVVLAAANADPGHEAGDGDLGLAGPGADEIDDVVAGIVGDPAAR